MWLLATPKRFASDVLLMAPPQLIQTIGLWLRVLLTAQEFWSLLTQFSLMQLWHMMLLPRVWSTLDLAGPAFSRLLIPQTAQYLHAMQGWIDTAIDRVVIIRIFDKPKEIEIREDPYQSLIHSITAPVDHVYLNMFNTQRLREDDLLNDLPSSINSKLEVIDFPLELDGTRNIPLSWQLTQSDKNLIRESFFTPKNKTSINRVKYHLLN